MKAVDTHDVVVKQICNVDVSEAVVSIEIGLLKLLYVLPPPFSYIMLLQ